MALLGIFLQGDLLLSLILKDTYMHVYTQVHKCSSTSLEKLTENFHSINVDFFLSSLMINRNFYVYIYINLCFKLSIYNLKFKKSLNLVFIFQRTMTKLLFRIVLNHINDS